jgi:3-oxoacyl-[acyl-carrier protein] reductase
MVDLELTERLAVVTGADSGIGLATARTLALEGARVLMTDLTQEELESARSEVERAAPEALVRSVSADLGEVDDVERLLAAADEFGGASVLAHLAGSRGAAGDFLELSDQGWRETLDVDLLGTVRVCRAFIPGMLERGYGRIVLTASENAVQPYGQEAPYDAAKAAVVNLGKSLSKAYGKRGVHVNVVSPAFIETPMTDAMMEQRARQRGISVDAAVASFLEAERRGITQGRRGQPQEVADVIAFLCSNRASFVDGANWRVDSGSVATAFG